MDPGVEELTDVMATVTDFDEQGAAKEISRPFEDDLTKNSWRRASKAAIQSLILSSPKISGILRQKTVLKGSMSAIKKFGCQSQDVKPIIGASIFSG